MTLIVLSLEFPGGIFRFLVSEEEHAVPLAQAELDCAVALATGESVRTIADLGFVPLTHVPFEREWDRDPLWVDWDEVDAQRHVLHPVQ